MFDLVIENAKIVAPGGINSANIGIRDGKIAELFKDGSADAAERIDAGGKLIFPGVIDGHVHFNDPGYTHREDFSHGTAAAAVGGVTTVVDMPMLNEPALTDKNIFEQKQAVVSSKSRIDYAFWGGAVNYNTGSLAELARCGVAAFKCFTCRQSEGYTNLTYAEIRSALTVLKEFDGLMGFHCEDDDAIEAGLANTLKAGKTSRADYLSSRPVSAELRAVREIIAIAKDLGTRAHICHVSHPDVAREIRRAKAEGVRVTAETCAHYLMFSGDDFIERGMLYKCSPPLRSVSDAAAMWEFVTDGTFDVIGSDHSPAPAYEKTEEKNGAFGAWGGLSGVQTTLQVMFEQAVNKHGLSPTVLAGLMSENPAKLYGLYGRKGSIAVGFDADLVLFDAERPWSITDESLLYLNQISAFSGQSGKGLPVCTLLRGKVIAREGSLCGEPGYGKLLTADTRRGM